MRDTHDYRNTVNPSIHLQLKTLAAAVAFTIGGSAAAGEPVTPKPAYDHTNQIIVKYKDSAKADKAALAGELSIRSGASLSHKRTTANGAEVFSLGAWRNNADVAELAARLRNDPNVEYAEPDVLLQTQLTPNDSRYNEQWHYFEATGGLNLPTAWDNATGAGAVVAVIDTGYLPHADLADNILPGYDFISDPFIGNDGDGRDPDAQDPGDWISAGECGFPFDVASSWHGTHVAGTIAALTNNSMGVAGVAFNAKILPARGLGKCGGFLSDIADAVVWSSGGSVAGVPDNTTPAHVINMSLGGRASCDATMQSAVDIARANGTTVVVAAGNSSEDAANHTPANCNGVITVAATDRAGGLAWYSNFGNTIEVSAPGGDTSSSAANGVLSTLNTGTTTPAEDSYDFYQGTSMASPHVAGLAALIYEAAPGITPDEVSNIITSTARPFPGTCNNCGTGIADAAAAVDEALNGGGGGGGGSFLMADIAGGLDTWNLFTVEIPEGMATLTVSTSGGRGNADVYVKFGADPTLTDFDCKSDTGRSNESCTIDNPSAGTWHIGVYGGERRGYRLVDLEAVWMP